MGAINAMSVWRSEAQLRSKWPQTKMMDPPAPPAPPAPTIPSTFDHSSSAGGVTLKAIMAQLQCMDARLDTLTTELYHVNTHVGCIAQRQAHLGVFVASPSPSPEAFGDEDAIDGNDNDEDEDEDEDASSSSDDETTSQ